MTFLVFPALILCLAQSRWDKDSGGMIHLPWRPEPIYLSLLPQQPIVQGLALLAATRLSRRF